MAVETDSTVRTYYENMYSCIEPQTSDLRLVFKDSTPTSPLIFIISPGIDPSAELLKFASEMKFADKLLCVSLGQGQGQGPVAVKKMKEGMENGKWVFLQDCHLFPVWMSTLERLIKQIDTDRVRFVIRMHIYNLFITTGQLRSEPYNLIFSELQWCSRNSKSHFARNLLANRRTNFTLIVRLGTKSDLLIEQLLIGEHYCTNINH